MQIRCGGCFKMYDDEFSMCPECGYYDGKTAKEPYQLYPGIILNNRYIIGNVLGYGGFGVTYIAWDKELESVVCIKEYYPSGIVNRIPGTSKLILFSGSKKKEFEFGLTRFIDEARNTTKFSGHKNIVNVYEYFEENNTAYFVMEYMPGNTLAHYIEENGKISLERSLEIIAEVGKALKDVHESGIIHRDISPDNIMICKDGKVKLFDFGAARFSAEEAEVRTIILKPGFAPPEQYDSISEQGPKTDIYALGATLYYMLTGVKPDESTNRKIADVLKEPKEIIKDLPQHINDTILKAMAIEPHLRFESVDEFEKSLNQEIKVTSLKKEKRTKKTKRLIGILSLLIVLSCAATVFSLNVKKKQEDVTLKPATIEVWIIADKGSGTETAYKQVVDKFTKEYSNIKIDLKSFSEKEYYARLDSAFESEKLPNLFMSNNLSFKDLNKTADLGKVIYPENNKIYFLINLLTSSNFSDCNFIDNYNDYFPEHKQLPSSFNVPVLYVNTNLIPSFTADSITSFDEIKEHISDKNKLVINADLQKEFTDIFEVGISGSVIKGNVAQFAEGKAAFYFSDTSEYFDCRKLLANEAGNYKVVKINQKSVLCKYQTLWSVNAVDEDKDAAAYRLLTFMLSDNAQSTVFGSSNSEHALPINKDALKRYVSEDYGYSELAFIESQIKNYIFESK